MKSNKHNGHFSLLIHFIFSLLKDFPPFILSGFSIWKHSVPHSIIFILLFLSFLLLELFKAQLYANFLNIVHPLWLQLHSTSKCISYTCISRLLLFFNTPWYIIIAILEFSSIVDI